VPRDHARLLCSIWDNEDFVALDAVVQRAYFVMLSEPSISNAGVAMLTLKRWARLAADTPPDVFEEHLRLLADGRFLLIDWDTEELLVRTFIRGDGVVKQPHILLNAARSARSVRSAALRAGIARELRRVDAVGRVMARHADEVAQIITSLDGGQSSLNPSAKGSTTLAARSETPPEGSPEPFTKGFAEGFQQGLPEGHGEGEGEGVSSRSVGTYVPPKITKALLDEQFASFWAVYPRKESKQGAKDKFGKLRKGGLDAQVLVDGAKRYADYCVQVGRDREKIKHPTTWLNQGCWDDELAVQATGPPPGADLRVWVNEQWQAGATAEICRRTSLRYEIPDVLPRDVAPADAERWHLTHRRNWITAHKDQIITALEEASDGHHDRPQPD
jgi:hypothetical protein